MLCLHNNSQIFNYHLPRRFILGNYLMSTERNTILLFYVGGVVELFWFMIKLFCICSWRSAITPPVLFDSFLQECFLANTKESFIDWSNYVHHVWTVHNPSWRLQETVVFSSQLICLSASSRESIPISCLCLRSSGNPHPKQLSTDSV